MQVIWCLKFCNMTKSGGDNPPAPNSGGLVPPSSPRDLRPWSRQPAVATEDAAERKELQIGRMDSADRARHSTRGNRSCGIWHMYELICRISFTSFDVMYVNFASSPLNDSTRRHSPERPRTITLLFIQSLAAVRKTTNIIHRLIRRRRSVWLSAETLRRQVYCSSIVN